MPRKHKQSKNPEFVAKREARHQAAQKRQKNQAPIVKRLQNQNLPKQEIRKMMMRYPEVFKHNRNVQIVRFCLPNYPQEWISMDSQVEPFANFINDAFRNQNQVDPPLDISMTGGYVLVLLRDEQSAMFAQGLLPGLRNYMGTGIREPSLEEIEQFHAGINERSPGMFARHQKHPQKQQNQQQRNWSGNNQQQQRNWSGNNQQQQRNWSGNNQQQGGGSSYN